MKKDTLEMKTLRKLPPITQDDRAFKAQYDATEGKKDDIICDLGEDIELKEKLAKKLHWKRARKPMLRVLWRNNSIILYKDYYHQYVLSKDAE